MNMRIPLLAAATAGVLSLGLMAASADAVQPTHGRTLVGSTTCDQGEARLATTVDKAGTERGTVTLTGLGSKRWRGSFQLNPAAAIAKADDGDDDHLSHAEMQAMMGGTTKRHYAHNGRISLSAHLKDSRSLDAQASFTSPSMSMCEISVMSRGGQYMLMGDGMLAIRTGMKPTVMAMVGGEARHRYAISFALTTPSGTQTRTLVRTAGSMGMLDPEVHDFKGLSAFTEATVTVQDLTVPVAVQKFSLGR